MGKEGDVKKDLLVSLSMISALWFLVAMSVPILIQADEHALHDHPGMTMEGSGSTTAEHTPSETGFTLHEGHMEGHHHRPAILPPDEDRVYSELNHHIAGVFVLFVGGLALLAASDDPRRTWARYGWSGLFLLLGGFLFVRHDPESWPWGPLPL